MSRRAKRGALNVLAALLLLLPFAPTVLVYATPNTSSAVTNGISYLSANQSADGSITGFGGESEWSAIALVTNGGNPSTFLNGSSNTLTDFLETEVPTTGAPATTIERKILAINAIGGSTANFAGINYNTLLQGHFNNNQLGDTTLLNDDIFGVIAIDATNETSLLPAAQAALDYLIAHQSADGGFSYTTNTCDYCGSDSNDTAAALVAFFAAEHLGLSNPNLAIAKSRALAYLLTTQQPDGGFSYDSFSPSDGNSTAWSLMALNALGMSNTSQAQLAQARLLNNQNQDGGFSYGAYGYTSSDTATTPQALIALSGTTWLLRPAVAVQTASPTTSSSGSVTVVSTTSSNKPSSNQVTVASNSGQTNYLDTPNNDDETKAQSTAQSSGEVLGASEVNNSQPTNKEKKIDKSSKTTTYAAYSLLALVGMAITWFVLQSSKKEV